MNYDCDSVSRETILLADAETAEDFGEKIVIGDLAEDFFEVVDSLGGDRKPAARSFLPAPVLSRASVKGFNSVLARR